ncbi:MAG TPA: hypothetical protein PLD88_10155, partial [Candidatus Berkiella sp.]|nr:hypothetical protein [Candidatus Berkiella sp.]
KVVETLTGTVAETVTQAAEVLPELAETAGETVKETITSENAAGLLSTLLEGGSSLFNGAWDGISGGASYIYNNPSEVANGTLETAGEFLCDNAL